MDSMLVTVWLILGAMSFGAMMDYGGFNSRLITPIVDRVKSVGGTIAVVMFTAPGFNIVAGDQYTAIVLPPRMFMVEFRKRGLHPGTLATAVENSDLSTSLWDSSSGSQASCGCRQNRRFLQNSWKPFPW